MLFADVSDIEVRWRTLTSDERDRATALIEDASAMIATLAKDIDVADENQLHLINTVVCNMVIRSMSATESDSYGVDSMSMTAGVYSQSWNYNNPTGDLYLTKLEKRLLGITTSYIDSIQPMMRGDHHD
ncbi:MAG: hypothetical protein IIZ12_06515 [Eggerthellaceae bacterium]|nr:hypothetical protein [Eggerthellaceae bacterium]